MYSRKIQFLGFILMMLLFFVSCTKNPVEDEIRIGVSQAMTKDDWRRIMNDAMELQAALDPRIRLDIYDADYSINKQIADIERLISEKVDILIVSPIQSKPITPVVKKALDKGIPVLVVDRKTEDNNYTAYLGGDNYEVGRNAAKVIVSNTNGSVNVVEVKGMAGSSPAEERSQGFHQVLDQFPRIKIVKSIEGNWERESIEGPFKIFLLGDTKVDFVFAHNDRMARGVWEVARDLGMENRLKIIGVDGLNNPNGGIQMVKDGLLMATILYPTGGEESIKLALKILNNEPVPKNNILATTVIDKVNADIMKNQFDKINEQRIEIEDQLAAIETQQELYASQNNLLKVAISLLVIILSLAIYSIYSIFVIRKRNRQLQLTNKRITVQRNQIEKIAKEVKKSNEAKLSFFTGLSHEFKTPLTLILSSIESIGASAKEKGARIKNEVELIYNNSNRLLRLINQLLDFRKVEDRKFKLRPSKTNLYVFSEGIYKDFKREAKKRGISFNLISNNKNLEVYIDRNMIDKVYFNLLSNAFKFTPDNGKVDILIEDHKDKNIVAIHFRDSGIGIPKNELKQVFQPFFQGSNNRKNSSGLGLHLSKEFIEMHNGQITVKSVRGTEFVVTLYKGKAHLDEDGIIVEPDLLDTNILAWSFDNIEADDYSIQHSDEDGEKYSILIIEDNRDLSFFLKNKLKYEYAITLSDGTDAVEKALELVPDVILCDVNLQEKSGFEICEILKSDLRTSHIPIIILTALDNKESYLKGLKVGADLYLTKPFSYSILMQSIKSLLYNREKLRYYYTNNLYMTGATGTFGNIDQDFIANMNAMVKENLKNADFTVETLADALHISRVQLYRKVKAILGISISEYISNFKLERAKSMLENTDLSISEIAYANGFSSPNYFSTSFKNKYGTSPVSYKKSI